MALVITILGVAGGAQGASLSFALPGEIEGHVTTTAQRALVVLVFENGSGILSMEGSGGQAINHTTFHAHSGGDNFYESVAARPDALGSFKLAGRSRGPSSLVILGTLSNSSIADGRTSFLAMPAESDGICPLNEVMTETERDHPVVRSTRCLAEDAPGLYQGVSTHEDGAPVRFEFESVEFAEWFGWNVGCQSEWCPSGGGFAHHRELPADTYTRVLHHQEVVPDRGTLQVEGVASVVLLAGVGIDVAVDGWIRLPQVQGAPDCADCVGPENQTLYAEGQMSLTSLIMREDGRVQGEMNGDLTGARFDEADVDVARFLSSDRAVLATALAATVTLGLIGKLVAGALFTKLSKEKALEHPRRQVLYRYIQEHPGANFRELVRKSEIASGTARHHLSVLKRSGHIVEKPHGGTVRFFENHGKYEATWGSVVLLREEPLKQLYDWMAAHPNVPQKAILEGMEAAGWSRSTTQHRLLRLQEGALVTMRPQGRLKFYSVVVPGEPRRIGPPPVVLGRAVAA